MRPTPFGPEILVRLAALLVIAAFLVVQAPALGADTRGEYIVRPGDTLWAIARRYGVSVEHLAEYNSISNKNRIYPGQRLQIPGATTAGNTHTITRGDTLWDLSRRYGVSLEALRQANPGLDPQRLIPGTVLTIPGRTGDRTLPDRGAVTFAWPLRGTISSPYGARNGGFHYGLDIVASTGTSIRAAGEGRVVESGWKGAYGYTVVIDHGDGYTTLYAHASRLLVQVGERVNQGQVIARVGSTGRSTGPHLHFEIRINDQPVNPRRYLR